MASIPWSPEDLAILKQYYPLEGRAVLTRLPGRTYEAVRGMASKLGVFVQSETRSRIWANAGRKKYCDPGPEEIIASAAEIRRENDQRLRDARPRQTVADRVAASLSDIPDDLDPDD